MIILNTFRDYLIKFLFIILIIFCSLYAQNYPVRIYTIEDGLPSPEVFDVTQDNSGRMWFATKTGVTVYDGNYWNTQTQLDGLPILPYFKIDRDSKGTIWTITNFYELNISFLESDKWKKLSLPDFIQPKLKLTTFNVGIINQQTAIAFGTEGQGLYLWSNNKWKVFNKNNGLVCNRVNSIEIIDEKLYIGTDRGLFILQNNKIDKSLIESIAPLSESILGVSIDKSYKEDSSNAPNKLIWILGEHWVGFLENGVFTNFKHTIELSKIENIFLMSDNQRGLYYGSPFSINYFNIKSKSFKTMGRNQGLITDGATSAYIDRENNIWFTSTRGISKISSKRFANYNHDNGLLTSETTAIWEIKPGSMVLGHNDGLTFLQDGQITLFPLIRGEIRSPHQTRVLDICGDKSGNIWVAASLLGLAKIDSSHNVIWYDADNGLLGMVNSVIIDSLGIVWAATSEGVFTLDGNYFKRYNIINFNLDLFVRRLFLGPDNSIYLATAAHGIIILKNNNWVQASSSFNKRADNIYAVLTDIKGTTWVGTKDGLYELKDNNIKPIEKGLHINNPIYFITEDFKGRLWFGTDNGVIRRDKENIVHYTVDNGLAGRETNRAAGLVDSGGKVWIGTDNGLSIYQEEFDEKNVPPLVSLTYLMVSNNKYSLQETNSFRHNQNDITFHFQAISFVNENSIRFISKLEGFEEEWSPEYASNNGSIRYTNLAPGYYSFLLKAKNVENVWSQEIISGVIYIQKPFWTLWWFIILIFMLAVFILYSIVEYFSQKRLTLILKKEVKAKTEFLQKEISIRELAKEKYKIAHKQLQTFTEKLQTVREEERTSISRELHDELGSQLTALRIDLSTLSNDSNHPMKLSSKKLQRMMLITSESIKFIKKISSELRPSLLDDLGLAPAIKWLLRNFKERTDINYDIIIVPEKQPSIDSTKEIILYRILQESLTNIIKHAKATKVSVFLSIDKQDITLTIEDNGLGIKRSDINNINSLGLLGMKERVNSAGGNLIVSGTTGKGTTVKVSIPRG